MERLTRRIDGSLVFPSELVGVTMTPDNEYIYALLQRLAAYEDTELEPEEIKSLQAEYAVNLKVLESYRSIGSVDCLRELAQADREGRCVVLPFPLHRMLLNTSDPYNPEQLKDFRISATWTHCGIVFHSPWDIFLQNIEKGYIRLMREEAEAMLEGGTPDAKVD